MFQGIYTPTLARSTTHPLCDVATLKQLTTLSFGSKMAIRIKLRSCTIFLRLPFTNEKVEASKVCDKSYFLLAL